MGREGDLAAWPSVRVRVRMCVRACMGVRACWCVRACVLVCSCVCTVLCRNNRARYAAVARGPWPVCSNSHRLRSDLPLEIIALNPSV
jgi:hypothetical protein